ncbi:motility protein A [Tepiditoga spiralis]|uniref:Motility protein A n=1 Tax=Tepiditoga spiralis TaxID=2108365 RepID=A0A7G1GCC7_9BACT|nr:motility protein A [Tepiditoga spiralis]BBE32149.1 motility protein A [Tepiditoga spiralis]
MDISSLAGIVLALVAFMLGVGANIGDMIDPTSIFITVVGSIGATLIAHPKDKSFKIVNIMMSAIKNPTIDNLGTLRTLYSFAEKARRDGMIALEEDIPSIDDEFIKDGLRAAVDGTDPEEIRKILEIKMELFEEDDGANAAVLDSWGAFAPAFGMIGTLVGLVLLLKTLNDPTTLGPKMSVALITTLYGALVANIFALPMAEKLKKRTSKFVNQKRMSMEGILSIVQGENPRLMEEKLKAFLSAEERKAYEAEKGENA